MSVIGGNLGNSLEAIRPWLSPVVLLAILGVVTRNYQALRKANTADKALDVAAEETARDAYASAVRGFREEVRALKKEHGSDREEWERRHNECERARDEFKERVEALRDLVGGLNRVILQNSAAGVLVIEGTPDGYASEEVRRAAQRVDRLFAPKAEESK